MTRVACLRVLLIKPSKYNLDGWVERYRRGGMPNCTLPYMTSLTPRALDGVRIEVEPVDEYVHTDLRYLERMAAPAGGRTLVALVGVQSHQFHRALDLAAVAHQRGALAVMGGPHPMTCDTSELQGRGVSFALAEAERVWEAILRDAIAGELRPTYGGDGRWAATLDPPVLQPPPARDLRRYASKLFGVYPARGCPYSCSYCSIIKIAGHQVRSQPLETTLASLRAAKRAGAGAVFFTSDNFNKYPEAPALLEAMIAERIELPFIAQCDLQVYKQERLVERMGRAGCIQIFLGVESFDREALRAVGKHQNSPERYRDVRRLCVEHGVATMFSTILGFPGDTAASVAEHVEVLRSFDSELASFYVLAPLPGTAQYDEFLAAGTIDETNLDRFDSSCLTFRHPNFTRESMVELVYRCYRDYYRVPDVLRRGARAVRRTQAFARAAMLVNVGLYGLVMRMAARGRVSGRREISLDFAGGLGRARVDHVDEYMALRRRTHGFSHAPLPRSLRLSAADEAINRSAKLKVVRG